MRLETLTENQIIITFIALALLLIFAHVFGNLAEKIKGPRVVDEILGGMILGGSCLFLLFPNFANRIFFNYAEEGQVLNIFYQLGLIFLMFLSGYNTDIKLNKRNSKNITLVFLGATILPMLCAIPFINLFKDHFIGAMGNEISFGLVFCIGVAITSIPVISKIFFDMSIMNTKFANTILTVATFQDLCLWILLNIATGVAATGDIDIPRMLIISATALGLFAIVAFISHKIQHSEKPIKTRTLYTVSFIALLLTCGTLSMLGINIMYSAFLVGYIDKALFGKTDHIKQKIASIEDFAFTFFVPIYFALVGIQLNVIHDFSFLRFITFFVIAFMLEFIGTWLLLLFSKISRPARMNFAITMNARGGPGIVLATVTYAAGIINLEFFTVLILTTMLSSMIAGYYLRYQQRKNPKIFDSYEIEKTK